MSCVAATMVIKCGFDAGKLYKDLLKMTKYSEELCEVQNSEETCDASHISDEDKLSEIYYSLVHRFGSILEQVTEPSTMNETESIFQSDESIISEAVKKALNSIDYSEEVTSERPIFENVPLRSEDESRKWPVITEQFKGLLFYNYSNEVFEFYWRQPGSFPIERVACEHVLTPHVKGVTFECIVHHRSKEPECYYNRKPTTTERITPELIRDIDLTIPEDSALDIGEGLNLTDYLFDYQRFRMSWEYFISARLVVRIDTMRELNRNLQVEYPNSHVCAKELRFYDIINDKDIPWWQCPSLFSDDLRNEIVTFLFGRKKVDDVLFLSVFNDGDKSYVHLFEPLLHAFDRVVCERVNECHPRGRGVFKCSLKRRDLEGCNSCCYTPRSECKARLEQLEAKRKYLQTLTSTEEGSGAFEDASVHLNDEATTAEEATNFVTEMIGADEDLVALDVSDWQSDSESESSSDVNLLLLPQNYDANAFLDRTGDVSDFDGEMLSDSRSQDELDMYSENIVFLFSGPIS